MYSEKTKKNKVFKQQKPKISKGLVAASQKIMRSVAESHAKELACEDVKVQVDEEDSEWLIDLVAAYQGGHTYCKWFGDHYFVNYVGKEEFHDKYLPLREGDKVLQRDGPMVRVKPGGGQITVQYTGNNYAKWRIEEACVSIIPDLLGSSKDDFPWKFMLSKAKGILQKNGGLFENHEEFILDYLTSDEFKKKWLLASVRRTRLGNDIRKMKWESKLTSLGWNSREVPVVSEILCIDVPEERRKKIKKNRHLFLEYRLESSQGWKHILRFTCYFVVIMCTQLLWAIDLSEHKVPDLALFLMSIFVMVGVVIHGYNKWPFGMINRIQQRIERVEAVEKPIEVRYLSLIIPKECPTNVSILPPQRPGTKCSIENEHDFSCKGKNVKPIGTLFEKGALMVPLGCRHSLHNAVRKRILFDRKVDKGVIRKIWKNFMPLLTNLIQYDFTLDEYVADLPARRKKKIYNAGDILTGASFKRKMFVKQEAYIGKTMESMKERCICMETDEMQKALGPFFKGLQKTFKERFSKLFGNLIFDCGLSAEEVGEHVLAMAAFKFLYEFDVSSWDGSLDGEWYNFELEILKLFKNVPCYKMLKRWWKKNRASSKGVKYECTHGRCSGDPWTTVFNSMINLAILYYIFGEDLYAIVKGDDGGVGTNTPINVNQIKAFYAKIGMTVKVFSRDLDSFTYCSGRVYQTDSGLKWGVDPIRVLAKFGLNLNHHPKSVHKRLLVGTAISMIGIAHHVPIVGPFLSKLASEPYIPLEPTREEWKNYSDKVDEIHIHSYLQLADQYGVDVHVLVELEEAMSQVNIERLPGLICGPGLDTLFSKVFGVEIADFNCYYRVEDEEEEPTFMKDSLSIWWKIWLFCIGPLVEEYCKKNLVFMLILILFETYCGSPNALLHLVSVFFPYQVNVVLHVAWNIFVYHRVGLINHLDALKMITKTKKGKSKQQPKRTKTQSHKISVNDVPTSVANAIVAKALRATGSSAGRKIGNYLGAADFGQDVGMLMGAGISRISGYGDYKISSNSLYSNGVPNFGSAKRSIRFKNREFLGNVTGTTSYSNRYVIDINPGLPDCCPYFSAIAQNFDQYRIWGMCLNFVSTCGDAFSSTNNSAGSVMMAAQYNRYEQLFTNKTDMINTEFAVSGKPSLNMIHAIECAPKERATNILYVRTGETASYNDDLRFYDHCRFTLATEGMQIGGATLGELWITYDIELMRPAAVPRGLGISQFLHISAGGYDNTDILGTIQLEPRGNLYVGIFKTGAGWDSMAFNKLRVGAVFFVAASWVGGSTASMGLTVTPTNASATSDFDIGTVTAVTSSGATATKYLYHAGFIVTGAAPTLVFSAATLPSSGTYVDIFVFTKDKENWTLDEEKY